jgi:hypothetical protein
VSRPHSCCWVMVLSTPNASSPRPDFDTIETWECVPTPAASSTFHVLITT